MTIKSQGWSSIFSIGAIIFFCLFNGRGKKKVRKDLSRTKPRRYLYKEMESGTYPKSNIIITSNSIYTNFS